MPEPPEQRIELRQDEPWDEMARRGMACRALILAAHRVPLPVLEATAQGLVRVADDELKQLEVRALDALGIDMPSLQGMTWTEIQLWRAVADPTLPAAGGSVFGWSKDVSNGLGGKQWVEVIAEWPDSWDNHPDHPRRPEFTYEEFLQWAEEHDIELPPFEEDK